MKHAPGRMERDGRAQLSCVHGRGEAGAHPALAPRRICGMARLDARLGSRALWRRCLCGSLPRGELFKQSFSSSKPPRSALPTPLASCWCRQSRRKGSGGGGIVPRWAQSSRAACPRALRARLRWALELTVTHTRCCNESHQHAWKLGLIFINLPGLRLDLESSCMDGYGKASSCAQARFVRLCIPILTSRWGQDGRRQKGRRRLGGTHISGGTSRNIPKAPTVPEDSGGAKHIPLLQHTGDAAPSPRRKMEQDAEGRRALNSQFPSLKADKFKTANVPRKMRPWEIYSSPRLTAPIRCVCQPGSLLKNQDKAAAGPHCPPNGWQRERKGRREVAARVFFPSGRC